MLEKQGQCCHTVSCPLLLSDVELISCIIKVLRKLSIEIWYHEKRRYTRRNEGYNPENTFIISYYVNIIKD